MLSTRSATPFDIGRPARTSQLNYRAECDLWWLSLSCEHCGGIEVPLTAQISSDCLDDVVARVTHEVELLGCPVCYALERRESAHGDPEVWYDPIVMDWVVRVPDDDGPGAILPLEIPWFDAQLSVVYHAAADLVFAGDAFSDGDW